ncbi:unnamed protein product [Amoebophrya sp. A25]|nr:unnamed protein product [Amoebophrya sp. A25]|eukprot:GSA25T00009500001.1
MASPFSLTGLLREGLLLAYIQTTSCSTLFSSTASSTFLFKLQIFNVLMARHHENDEDELPYYVQGFLLINYVSYLRLRLRTHHHQGTRNRSLIFCSTTLTVHQVQIDHRDIFITKKL